MSDAFFKKSAPSIFVKKADLLSDTNGNSKTVSDDEVVSEGQKPAVDDAQGSLACK